MENIRRRVATGLLAAAGLIVSCQTGPLLPSAEERQEAAQAVIGNWSEFCRLSAARLIEEHGPPDEIESGRLTWHRQGLLDTLSAWNVPSEFEAAGGAGNIESSVAYVMPSGKKEQLAAFDHELRVSRDGTKLAATSNSEALNFLALNLADEIVRGIKTPQEARDFYAETTELAAAGKTSPFMQGLLFLPSESRRH